MAKGESEPYLFRNGLPGVHQDVVGFGRVTDSVLTVVSDRPTVKAGEIEPDFPQFFDRRRAIDGHSLVHPKRCLTDVRQSQLEHGVPPGDRDLRRNEKFQLCASSLARLCWAMHEHAYETPEDANCQEDLYGDFLSLDAASDLDLPPDVLAEIQAVGYKLPASGTWTRNTMRGSSPRVKNIT